MSFYDDASWVLIPEGIKEDVVYAQKPTDGLGDLTFTRASDATRTNSAGVIERTPWNLFTFSEDFSNAAWTKTASSVSTTSVQSPIGPNAFLYSISNLSTNFITQAKAISNTTNTFSIFVKKNVGSLVQLNLGSFNSTFNFDTETISNTSLMSFQIFSNGWYRLILTANPATNTAAFLNIPSSGSLSDSVYIACSQVVEGTDAKPYFATTNRQDVPRLDYRNADGSVNSCPRLLLEPQRTNSIRNSTMVGAVAGSPGTLPTNWGINAAVTQTIVGTGIEAGLPYIDVRFSGTNTGANAQILFESATQITASNAQTWAGSFWFKIISAPTPPLSYQVRFREGTAAGAFVADGLLTFVPTTNLQRFTYVRTNTGALTERIQPALLFPLTIGTTYDFTIRIAAPQMELGAYATTFIPTTTAAVTRIVDAFSRSGIYTNNFITAAGGTWFVDLSNIESLVRSNTTGLFIGDSVSSNTGNQFIIRNPANGRLLIAKVVSGVNDILFNLTTDAAKIAINWNGTTANLFVNGVKEVSATDFTTTIMENMVSGVPVPFYFNEMALFPVPLTDDQCIEITTL
jgi:hypothetical protein